MWIPKWYFEVQADRMDGFERRIAEIEAHYSGKYELKFSEKELAVLNQMISIALLSRQIEFSKEAESVHQKISNEILQREADKRR